MDSNSNEPVKNNNDLNAPPMPPQADGKASQEKNSSKKNIAIKISIGLFAIVFVLVGYVGMKMYQEMKQIKEVFNTIEEMSNYAAPKDLPRPRRKLISSANSGADVSKLFKESGFIEQGESGGRMPMALMSPEDTKTMIENAQKIDKERIIKALNKYSARPIVKEFMNDLKKDPDFQKALEAKKTHNPLEVIASINRVGNMKEIVGKYAMRPSFMKLMLDIMQDPEMKPLFKMMPNGMMPDFPNSAVKNIETEIKNEEFEFNSAVLGNNSAESFKKKVSAPPPPELE